MMFLRSLLFNVLFFGSTTLMALVVWPALFMGRRTITAVRQFWIDWIMWLTRRIAGIRVELRHAERLPAGPALIASKHQSAWETLWFNTVLKDPAIVLKKELTEIPIFGAFIDGAGMVPIDRKAGGAAVKRIVGAARPAIEAGRPVLIFPQGTRVAPGDARAYQPGVYALYRALGVPLVPVALNSGLYWSRNAFTKRPGTILVEVLPPIPPGLDRVDFMARLQEDIETASRRLEAEAHGSETTSTVSPAG